MTTRTVSSLRFDFASPVSAFAFNWGAADNYWGLDVYSSGDSLLGTYSVPPTVASNAGEYFGFAASGISYAILTDLKDIFSYDYVFIDNFTYATSRINDVPEPATLLLLGSGMLGFGLFRRMRGSRHLYI